MASKRKRFGGSAVAAPPRPWWGEGDAPHLRWPGVALEIPCIWDEKAERWQTPDGAYYFDAEAADYAEGFFPTMLEHHIGTEWNGKPFELLPYQAALVRTAFGWKRSSDGLRRFRKVFLAVPKGSGKSPLGAGLGLLLAFFDGEAGSEVYAVAADKKQAGIVFGSAKTMVERNTRWAGVFDVLRDSITARGSTECFQVLSSDASTKHGFRPHGIIFDEFHAQPDRDLFDTLYRGMGKRQQPMLVMITTAGDDDESICVAPNTKVLTEDLRWVRADDVQVGDTLAGFDEHKTWPEHRKWRRSRVTTRVDRTQPCYEIALSDGTQVVCSEDHMWLIQTAGRRVCWRKTKDLTDTDTFFKVAEPWETDTSWEAGYLAGIYDGEGHITTGANSNLLMVFTQRANGILERGEAALTKRGFRYSVSESSSGVYQVTVTKKRDVLQLLGTVRPQRLLEKFIQTGYDKMRFKSFRRPTLATKKFIGDHPVVSLKTSTNTFIAEGLASHNCFEEWDYARRVLKGDIQDDAYLPMIFELRADEDWASVEALKRVNPGYGITMKASYFETEIAAAQSEPRKRNSFIQLHGNRWTNQATAWIPVEWWDACEPEPIDIGAYLRWSEQQTSELAGVACAAGLDLAQKIDLACFSVVFRRRLASSEPVKQVDLVADEHGKEPVQKTVALNYAITILPFFWIPEDTMKEREKADGVPYSIWREAGLVTPTEGVTIDYTRIYDDIKNKILPRFPRLKQGVMGYDPAFGTDIATTLRDKAGLQVKEVLQNYTHMSEPCYIFEALVKAKRVRHGGHRILRNHLEHTAVKMDDARRLRPVKPKKAGKHIDGTVASIMGVRTLAEVPDRKKSGGVMFV